MRIELFSRGSVYRCLLRGLYEEGVRVLYRQGQWQLLGGDGPLRDWLLLHVGVCVCCTDRDSGSCWAEMAPYVTGSYCMWVCVCVVQTGTVAAAGWRWPPT